MTFHATFVQVFGLTQIQVASVCGFDIDIKIQQCGIRLKI